MDKPKILLICGASETIINFRKSLIVFFQNKGFDVSIIIGDDLRLHEIQKLNITTYVVPFTNRSTNPFLKLKLKRKITSIIKTSMPDMVFTFQTTPNLIGVPAAKNAGINKVFSMVEGVGDPFQPESFKEKIIGLIVSNLYKRAFKTTNKVFFLNDDDKKMFVDKHLIEEEKAIVINGIGVDVGNIKPNYALPKEKRVLCLSRLLINKGIIEYCEMARIVKKTRKDIIFELYGEESQLKARDIQQFIDDGSIYYGGYTNEPHKLIERCRVLSSHSFREGFPMVIMEAMAIGRPVVASNVIGNKNVVINGKTGILIPPHDIKEHAEQIIRIIDDDKAILLFGKNAREVCENRYNSEQINNIIYGHICKA